jgi:hypothetical protein
MDRIITSNREVARGGFEERVSAGFWSIWMADVGILDGRIRSRSATRENGMHGCKRGGGDVVGEAAA